MAPVIPPTWDEHLNAAYMACANTMPKFSANNPVMTRADRGTLNSRNRDLTTRDRFRRKAVTAGTSVGALLQHLML